MKFLAVAQIDRAFYVHAGELGGGPGHGEEADQGTGAAHRLGAQAVGLSCGVGNVPGRPPP